MLSVDHQDEVAWATAHLPFLPELPLRRRWINDNTITIVLLLATAKRLLDCWLLYQDCSVVQRSLYKHLYTF